MDGALIAAAGILLVLAGLHSILGERLIFRVIGRGRAVGDPALSLLSQRRWDALWSTWHLVSIWGVGVAVVLIALGAPDRISLGPTPILAATMGVSAVFWSWGTRLKHPAWLGFLLAAVLLLL